MYTKKRLVLPFLLPGLIGILLFYVVPFFGGIWYFVPNIDETIQRYVPGRASMTSDVLLDMCGFACGFALCLVCAGITSLFRHDS